jgi:hypothetical protein
VPVSLDLGTLISGVALGALIPLLTGHLGRRHERHLWLMQKRYEAYLEFNGAIKAVKREWPGSRRAEIEQGLDDKRDVLHVLAPEEVAKYAQFVTTVAKDIMSSTGPGDSTTTNTIQLGQALNTLIGFERLDLAGLRDHWWQGHWTEQAAIQAAPD